MGAPAKLIDGLHPFEAEPGVGEQSCIAREGDRVAGDCRESTHIRTRDVAVLGLALWAILTAFANRVPMALGPVDPAQPPPRRAVAVYSEDYRIYDTGLPEMLMADLVRAASMATLPPPSATTRLATAVGAPRLTSRRKVTASITPRASSSPGIPSLRATESAVSLEQG